MSRYYEIVTDILDGGAPPVQYVGVYVLHWGKTSEPEVGFFGSSIGDFKQGWYNAAQVLKRQRDEALSSLQSIVDITEEERPPAPECYVREVAIQAIARHALKGG